MFVSILEGEKALEEVASVLKRHLMVSNAVKTRCSEICNQLASEPQSIRIINDIVMIRKEICSRSIEIEMLMEKYDDLRLENQCLVEERIYEQATKDAKQGEKLDTFFDTLPDTLSGW